MSFPAQIDLLISRVNYLDDYTGDYYGFEETEGEIDFGYLLN